MFPFPNCRVHVYFYPKSNYCQGSVVSYRVLTSGARWIAIERPGFPRACMCDAMGFSAGTTRTWRPLQGQTRLRDAWLLLLSSSLVHANPHPHLQPPWNRASSPPTRGSKVGQGGTRSGGVADHTTPTQHRRAPNLRRRLTRPSPTGTTSAGCARDGGVVLLLHPPSGSGAQSPDQRASGHRLGSCLPHLFFWHRYPQICSVTYEITLGTVEEQLSFGMQTLSH
jgi:hypothetical protein